MNYLNYIILILVGVAGIWIGRGLYTGRHALSAQSAKKEANKKKILEFLQSHSKIKNNDVEHMLGVSDATAERYLHELEKEGIIEQHGKIGRNVFYTLN